MNSFEYASPRTIAGALEVLDNDSVILAGGTDLLSLMKEGLVAPKRVVNIKEIDELKGINVGEDGSVTIGALVTLEEVLESPDLAELCPSVVEAAAGVRSPQIQSVGTVAGDLCQRPRCWYYRNGFGLTAMKDGKSLARDGDNRYHAILGNDGAALFVNPSSLAPALIALDAKISIVGKSGSREVALADFFQTPSSDQEKEYKLEAGEILTAITIPSPAGKKVATYEIREKQALDWPLTAAAVAIEMNGDQVSAAKVVLGHVAPVPWVSAEAGAALAGKQVTAESAAAAGDAAVKSAKALSKNGFKIQLARVAVKRAVLRAAGMEV
ncbi:MAG: FAD binding domain-containing protein [Acidobacteriota bacterium]|nr:MAG: FAD binding domain-containing protein [Acidobacteriota bacterium]